LQQPAVWRFLQRRQAHQMRIPGRRIHS
jgi:hypothetical protein